MFCYSVFLPVPSLILSPSPCLTSCALVLSVFLPVNFLTLSPCLVSRHMFLPVLFLPCYLLPVVLSPGSGLITLYVRLHRPFSCHSPFTCPPTPFQEFFIFYFYFYVKNAAQGKEKPTNEKKKKNATPCFYKRVLEIDRSVSGGEVT